jgi:hypothetical protein
MNYVVRTPTAGQSDNITARQYCPHTATVTERLPKGSPHYAKLKCAACNAFLKFLPRPENAERRQLNGFKLAKLQMCAGLKEWERQFIDSLAKQGNKLSPKQQAVFDRLCETYLKGGAQ